jgi:hypothetical protein
MPWRFLQVPLTRITVPAIVLMDELRRLATRRIKLTGGIRWGRRGREGLGGPPGRLLAQGIPQSLLHLLNRGHPLLSRTSAIHPKLVVFLGFHFEAAERRRDVPNIVEGSRRSLPNNDPRGLMLMAAHRHLLRKRKRLFVKCISPVGPCPLTVTPFCVLMTVSPGISTS